MAASSRSRVCSHVWKYEIFMRVDELRGIVFCVVVSFGSGVLERLV